MSASENSGAFSGGVASHVEDRLSAWGKIVSSQSEYESVTLIESVAVADISPQINLSYGGRAEGPLPSSAGYERAPQSH